MKAGKGIKGFSPLLLAVACAAVLFVGTGAHAAPDNASSEILIMIDGTRPDVVREMAAKGLLPNLQKYFIDGGSWMENSFTSLSLTVPSWSTILTGVDVDRTGIKGNDVFNRETKKVTNYLDWRDDIIHADMRHHGAAYRTVREAGNYLLTDYFSEPDEQAFSPQSSENSGRSDDVYMTFFPLNDRFPMDVFTSSVEKLLNLDLWSMIGEPQSMIRMLFDFSGFEAIDRTSVDSALKVIRDTRTPKKRLIGIYMASVDHLTHLDAGKGRAALIEADYQVGRIMEALRGTRYADSYVTVVSDHGSLGGQDPAGDGIHNPLRGKTYALSVTNLSYLLGGWYNQPGYSDYNFNVETAFAAEGRYDLKNLSEVQLQPFQCTNLSRVEEAEDGKCLSLHKTNPGRITAAATTLETLSLPYASRTSNDWVTPNNWYTLTHYEIGKSGTGEPIRKNLIKDLELFNIENLAVFDFDTEEQIGHQPLDWLALSISAKDFNGSPASVRYGLRSDSDVIVLHQNDESEALILRENDAKTGKELYRYVPVKHFSQDKDGVVSFETQMDRDPLRYLDNPETDSLDSSGLIDDAAWMAGFHTDRDWATRYRRTQYPNTVSALSRVMSFEGGIQDKKKDLRADLFLNPRYGHIFAINNDVDQAEHGMFERESVNNLFMMAGPDIKRGVRVEKAVFATDVVPTIMHALGESNRITTRGVKLEGEPVLDIFTDKQ